MTRAYYNERDPYAAEWLRTLIADRLICDGDVDDRDIRDVLPSDLASYTQCHFFAGIGVWSHALRLAGWPDSRSVWTGSCPCQPFSAAGRGGGFADERHLWPHWHHLIRECRPAIVLGEQVASKDGLGWLDLVSSDLEGEGYAVGAADLCAAGFGAPHIRQRLWFVAHADGGDASAERQQRSREHGQQSENGLAGVLGDAEGDGQQQPRASEAGDEEQKSIGRPSLPGFWSGADWIACRDGKSRPVERGVFPLAHGPSRGVGRGRAHREAVAALPRKDQGNRTGRLRGYGNAISPYPAKEFVQAFLAIEAMRRV